MPRLRLGASSSESGACRSLDESQDLGLGRVAGRVVGYVGGRVVAALVEPGADDGLPLDGEVGIAGGLGGAVDPPRTQRSTVTVQ